MAATQNPKQSRLYHSVEVWSLPGHETLSKTKQKVLRVLGIWLSGLSTCCWENQRSQIWAHGTHVISGSYGTLWPFQILDANWKHGLMSKLALDWLVNLAWLEMEGAIGVCLLQASIPILTQTQNVRAHKYTLYTWEKDGEFWDLPA